jgi:NADH-quinone oxidoreductase subunit A
MGSSPIAPYLPMAVLLLFSGVLAVGLTLVASYLGPKRRSAIKDDPFECGSDPVGTARQRFAVKFYVIALLFIVFDIEAVFLYPWAVNFRALGWFGYAEMVVFAATLVVGLAYVWKKGALDWDT